jgi:adenosine/AMP kinase
MVASMEVVLAVDDLSGQILGPSNRFSLRFEVAALDHLVEVDAVDQEAERVAALTLVALHQVVRAQGSRVQVELVISKVAAPLVLEVALSIRALDLHGWMISV